MSTTLAAGYQPVLTPPPSPFNPPKPPPEKPTQSDLEDALIYIANGKTAAHMTARAADPARYDAYRTTEGLCSLTSDDDLAKYLAVSLVPGDELAEQVRANDACLAAAMTDLEARGWTQAKARAAYRFAAGDIASALRTAVAA